VSINELVTYVGQKGYLLTEGLQVPVQVLGVRQVWGNVQVLITPINGEGRKWVSVERFQEFKGE
jgi:hypothetical protein